MSFNPEKPYVGLDITNPGEIAFFLELETSHMPPYGYANNTNYVLHRSNACSLIKEFECNASSDPVVPFLAMSYYDNFISTHHAPGILENPLANYKLFVTCCFTLATKTINPNCDITVLLGYCFEPYDLYTMEHEIDRWLENRSCKRPITSLAFLDFFIADLLFVTEAQSAIIKNLATHRAYAQQYGIEYTKYKPSILAATAILWSCENIFGQDCKVFEADIYDARYLDKTSLTQALKLNKQPIVVNSTLPPRLPLLHDSPAKVVKYEPETGKGKGVWVDTDIRITFSPPPFHHNEPVQYQSISPPIPPLFDNNKPIPDTSALQSTQDVLKLSDIHSTLPPYTVTIHKNGAMTSSSPDSLLSGDNELIDDTASSFPIQDIANSSHVFPPFHDNQPTHVDKPPNVANIEPETLKRVQDLVRELSNNYNLFCSSHYRPQNALQAGTSASNPQVSPTTPPRFTESNTINPSASVEAATTAASAAAEEEDSGEESKPDVSSSITPALPPDDADRPPKKRRIDF